MTSNSDLEERLVGDNHDVELAASSDVDPAHLETERGRIAFSERNHGDHLFFRALLAAKVVFGCLIAVVVLIAVTHLGATASVIRELISSVQGLGAFAPLAYILLYVGFIACFLPAEFMHLAAGYIFSRIYGDAVGIVVAFLCSLAGAQLSGLCCFMISRYLLYDAIHGWMRGSTLFRAFNAAVQEGGLTFVALIRLSPILPYSLTSYMFGVTMLKTSHLFLGTFSGTPLILAFNFLGSALSDINDLDIAHFSWTWQRVILLILGIAMAVTSMVYITVLTRRKLASAYQSAALEGRPVPMPRAGESRSLR